MTLVFARTILKSPSLFQRSIKRLSVKTNKRLSKKRNENRTRPATSDTSVQSESISYDLFEVTTRQTIRKIHTIT